MIHAHRWAKIAKAGQARAIAPEVILPANVPFSVVEAVTAAHLVPVFIDIRPGLYVAEAGDQRTGAGVIPQITTQTAAVYLPHTYGNVPELEPIRAACRVHEVPLLTDDPPASDCMDAFRRLYDGLAFQANVVTFPEHLPDTDWRMTAFPLTLRKQVRSTVLGNCVGIKVLAARGDVTQDDRMAQCGTWIAAGDLAGARTIHEQAIVVPLWPSMTKAEADTIVTVVQGAIA
jgi:dTDP-4-amino-4,6-dideoxygalactose transaminase